ILFSCTGLSTMSCVSRSSGIETVGAPALSHRARAAFDVSVWLWPCAWIELRQESQLGIVGEIVEASVRPFNANPARQLSPICKTPLQRLRPVDGSEWQSPDSTPEPSRSNFIQPCHPAAPN